MKILSSFLLFIVFALPSLAQITESGDADPKIDLKLNLQAGDQYAYSVGMNQKLVQEVMGQSITIDQRMTTEYEYRVLSNDGQSMKIEVTYKRIQMNFDMPQNQIDYDSDLSPDGPLSAMNGLIGKPFIISMTDAGKVTKIEGYQEMIAGLGLGNEFKAMLSDSSLMQSLDQDIYAGRPVAMGESWNKSKTMDMSTLVLKSDLTYTLEGRSEDLAWINVNGEVSAVSNEAGYEMELSGKQEGTMETDLHTGMVSSGQVQMDINAKLIAQGFEVPMTINMEVTISGRKL